MIESEATVYGIAGPSPESVPTQQASGAGTTDGAVPQVLSGRAKCLHPPAFAAKS